MTSFSSLFLSVTIPIVGFLVWVSFFFFLHMYEANIFSHNPFFKWKIAKVCIESIFARTWSVCSALMIRKEAVKYDFTIWKKKRLPWVFGGLLGVLKNYLLLNNSVLQRSLSNTEDECTHLKEMNERTQEELRELANKYNGAVNEIKDLSDKLKVITELHLTHGDTIVHGTKRKFHF